MTKKRVSKIHQTYCAFCCLTTGKPIVINFRRVTKRCNICRRPIKESLNHSFSESEKEAITRILQKEKQFGKVLDTSYTFPEPLRQHLEEFEKRQHFAFLLHLEKILTDETEYARFKEFMNARRAEHNE